MVERINPYKPPQNKIDHMMEKQHRVPVQFWLYVGNAGNGKSLMLNRHILAFWAWTEMRGTFEECYSNLHVKTPEWWEGRPRETKDLEITNLAKSIQEGQNDDAIGQELEKMSDCMIAIDELQNWADRQNWQSVKSRLFNYILMQRRHQHYHIAGTIQDRGWLNRRTDYQIDFEVICQSMHKFARQDHIADWEKIPGQYIKVRVRDLSGLIRPYTYYEDHYEKSVRIGPMWPFFDTYSTYQNQDVFEPFRKMSIKSKKEEYDLDGDNQNTELGEVNVRNGYDPHFAENVCIHVMNACLNAGYNAISCNDFREMCHEQGLQTDPARIGRILAPYKVVRRRIENVLSYDFSHVPVREGAPV